jgi:glycosyltransferase involved in cell wall biosynthesis
MAKGKAIVSTRIGAEGIDVTHEQHLLVGDTAKEFADQVVRVLAEPELARRLGLRARELAEKTYAWSAVVGRLERFYEELLGRRTNART